MTVASTFVILQCQGIVHHTKPAIKGRTTGGCGKIYTAHKIAFVKRLNACPECGSSKAKWEGPARLRKPKPPTIEPPKNPEPEEGDDG